MSEKTIYINSGKCKWGQCVFCGWGKYEYPKLTFEELKELLNKRIDKVDVLKIFNSGSFLDEDQIVKEFRKYVIEKCEEFEIKNLIVETRVEFITQEVIDEMRSDKVHVIFAVGLEVADNEVLKKMNKGLTVEDYLKAAELIRKNNFGLRSYVLVNAPYSNIDTLRKSVKIAKDNSESVILLNWFPHGYSTAFDLWIEGKHKPLDKDEFEEMTKEFGDIEKDFDNFVFKPLWPQDKRRWINGATEKELLHPYCFVKQ